MNLFMERRAVDIRGYRRHGETEIRSTERIATVEARRETRMSRKRRKSVRSKVIAQSVRHGERGRKLQR